MVSSDARPPQSIQVMTAGTEASSTGSRRQSSAIGPSYGTQPSDCTVHLPGGVHLKCPVIGTQIGAKPLSRSVPVADGAAGFEVGRAEVEEVVKVAARLLG
jgi:hypothetical protein